MAHGKDEEKSSEHGAETLKSSQESEIITLTNSFSCLSHALFSQQAVVMRLTLPANSRSVSVSDVYYFLTPFLGDLALPYLDILFNLI